eukprot:364100-Chlamydomonas_euryale.AAC.57
MLPGQQVKGGRHRMTGAGGGRGGEGPQPAPALAASVQTGMLWQHLSRLACFGSICPDRHACNRHSR